ncbi:hypothetical protein DMH17_04995 [Raoultella planticola]|nr:hypothetical protein [Raoultella planticola]
MFAMTSPQTYHHQPRLREPAWSTPQHTTHVAILTSQQAWKAVNPQFENSLRDAGIRWQTNFLTTACTDAAVMTHLDSVRRQTRRGCCPRGEIPGKRGRVCRSPLLPKMLSMRY